MTNALHVDFSPLADVKSDFHVLNGYKKPFHCPQMRKCVPIKSYDVDIECAVNLEFFADSLCVILDLMNSGNVSRALRSLTCWYRLICLREEVVTSQMPAKQKRMTTLWQQLEFFAFLKMLVNMIVVSNSTRGHHVKMRAFLEQFYKHPRARSDATIEGPVVYMWVSLTCNYVCIGKSLRGFWCRTREHWRDIHYRSSGSAPWHQLLNRKFRNDYVPIPVLATAAICDFVLRQIESRAIWSTQAQLNYPRVTELPGVLYTWPTLKPQTVF